MSHYPGEVQPAQRGQQISSPNLHWNCHHEEDPWRIMYSMYFCNYITIFSSNIWQKVFFSPSFSVKSDSFFLLFFSQCRWGLSTPGVGIWQRDEKWKPTPAFVGDITLCLTAASFDYCQNTRPEQSHPTSHRKSLSSLFFIPPLGLQWRNKCSPSAQAELGFLSNEKSLTGATGAILGPRQPGLLKLKSFLFLPRITGSEREPGRRI